MTNRNKFYHSTNPPSFHTCMGERVSKTDVDGDGTQYAITLDLPGVSQERVTLQIESGNNFYGGRTLYVLIDNARQYHGKLAERYILQSASVENGQLKLCFIANEPDTILLPYNARGGCSISKANLVESFEEMKMFRNEKV